MRKITGNLIVEMRFFLVFTFLIISFWSSAQQWDNPANKYLNTYKKYSKASCPIPKSQIQHFVYFSRDRGKLKSHAMLDHDAFAGAQIMYSWKLLEPRKGVYDFSVIEQDLNYLEKFGKKLFIQLQDATFSIKNKPVPEYLMQDEYDQGAVLHHENKQPVGWVAKRWSKKVQERFALFLMALGKEFDGRIEGINLQETSLSFKNNEHGFTEAKYVDGIKNNMLALKKAFPKSTTMIYANFMPGEWLPWEDKGYLKGIYNYGQEIGVGLGAPDLMVTRKGQLNHALAQMHENTLTVPVGIAIQDGNYIGKTGADKDYNEKNDKGIDRNNIVPMLYAFASDFLKVDYMFWVDQKPYFEEDVLPCFD